MAAGIVGVAGIVPAIMLLGVLALADPIVAGLYHVAQALIALELATPLTLGVAIWRSGLLPKWVALAFPLAYFMAITGVLTLVGGLLMIVVGGWIAFRSAARAEQAVVARSNATPPRPDPSHGS